MPPIVLIAIIAIIAAIYLLYAYFWTIVTWLIILVVAGAIIWNLPPVKRWWTAEKEKDMKLAEEEAAERKRKAEERKERARRKREEERELLRQERERQNELERCKTEERLRREKTDFDEALASTTVAIGSAEQAWDALKEQIEMALCVPKNSDCH